MFKKILVTIFVGCFFSISAYNPDDLNLVLNPKCRAVCGLDLGGANLAGQNLSHKNFISVDFSGAMLEDVDFTGCSFTDCFFVDANIGLFVRISGATFKQCNLHKIIYPGTDLFVSCRSVDQLTQDTFRGVLVEAKFYSEIVPHLPGSGLCRRKEIVAEQQVTAAASAPQPADDQWESSDDEDMDFVDASDLK